MTTKSNKPADKTTTFGDEAPVEPTAGADATTAPKESSEEPKAAEAEITYVKWEDVEAEARADFEGHLFGRRLEEALYHVKKGFDLAGGK